MSDCNRKWFTIYFTYSISMQNDCGIINSMSCLKVFILLSNLEVSQVFLFLPKPVFTHVFTLVGNFASFCIQKRYFASLCILINDRFVAGCTFAWFSYVSTDRRVFKSSIFSIIDWWIKALQKTWVQLSPQSVGIETRISLSTESPQLLSRLGWGTLHFLFRL